jgi:hypothetical protein
MCWFLRPSVAEPEPQGAASFVWSRSRSRNAMQLRLRRLRLLRCCSTWVVFKKWHKLNDFIAFSMHIYYNFRFKESEEKRMSDLLLPFTPFKIFDLLYCRVGAGAGAAWKWCGSATLIRTAVCIRKMRLWNIPHTLFF